MPIICRSVYDRKIMQDLQQEEIFSDQIFDDRTNFAHIPNSLDRIFLINAVAVGALPPQKTAHDQLTFTATEIILATEWLDQEQCQAWVDLRNQAEFAALISCEMIVS
jgi:hypothetical protein